MNKTDLNMTRQYIRLFQMQLNSILEDMAKPAELLSGRFSDALNELHSTREHMAGNNQISQEKMLSMVDQLISQMFECISSLQFVDAKRQRIEHVADGLDYLIDVDDASNALNNDWCEIKNNIQLQYKMDSERDIYKKYLQEFDCKNDIQYSDAAN